MLVKYHGKRPKESSHLDVRFKQYTGDPIHLVVNGKLAHMRPPVLTLSNVQYFDVDILEETTFLGITVTIFKDKLCWLHGTQTKTYSYDTHFDQRPWNREDIKIIVADFTTYGTSLKGFFADTYAETFITGLNFNTSSITDMTYLFGHNLNSTLKTIILTHLNTSNVKLMDKMFYYLTELQTIDLSAIDTRKVTNASNFFGKCSKLENITFGNLCTFEKNTYFSYFFYYCSSLKKVLLTFNTNNGTTFERMFAHCNSLQVIKVIAGNFTCPAESKVDAMFKEAYELHLVDRIYAAEGVEIETTKKFYNLVNSTTMQPEEKSVAITLDETLSDNSYPRVTADHDPDKCTETCTICGYVNQHEWGDPFDKGFTTTSSTNCNIEVVDDICTIVNSNQTDNGVEADCTLEIYSREERELGITVIISDGVWKKGLFKSYGSDFYVTFNGNDIHNIAGSKKVDNKDYYYTVQVQPGINTLTYHYRTPSDGSGTSVGTVKFYNKVYHLHQCILCNTVEEVK